MTIKDKLKELPQSPGIYKMLNAAGNIIYVGKAKNLKNRVSQYFHNSNNKTPKVVEMMQVVHNFDYMVTDTELDAFIEECRLIKEIKPRYNRQLKNDRKYVYIKQPKEPFPKIHSVRIKADDGALYFGPFNSSHRVEAAIKYLNAFYPIRKCSTPKLITRLSGCLFKQLGSCMGVCTGQVSPEEYSSYLREIGLLLEGKDETPVLELSNLFQQAITELKFEKAAEYRDYHLGLKHVIGKQRLVQSSSKNRNILAVEFTDFGAAKFFFIKGNKLLWGELLNLEVTDKAALKHFLKELLREKFKVNKKNQSGLSQADIDEAQILYSYLKKNRKRIHSFWIPATRLKSDELLEVTARNIFERLLKNLELRNN